jgi:uncharacterized protein
VLDNGRDHWGAAHRLDDGREGRHWIGTLARRHRRLLRSSTDYLHLIGGQFATHPSKREGECVTPSSQENNYLPHKIEICPDAADHPIVAGVVDFELETEQYWVLTDDYNHVLATTTHPARDDQPWHRKVTCPAVWTRRWGRGRIFVATPGHQPDILRHESVRTIIERGLLWASR